MLVDITNCYAGANIFITGATGFVGLCLIEKLLRCIPDIGNIYILIRSKKDENSCARYMDLLENHIFDKIKEEKGVSLFRKIFPIPGDLSKENLDIHTENFNILIEKVDFVFHCAANLDFMDNLKNAVNINLLGTRRIIELCKKLNHLKGLIHVSSAYVNSNRKFAEEVIYPLPNNTDSMIALLNNLDEEAIKTVTPVILEGHTNAYTFTKALAENEIISSNDLFPTAIVRPSMITGAWKEPIPGWTNSKNGPQGFFMAVSKGIVRRLPIDKHLIYDYIPVDIVVNEIISSGWYISQIKPPETLILHCTTSAYKPFTWSIVESEVKCLLNMYPVQSAIWYPTLKLIPSMSVFRISAFIFHMIPAYCLDVITRLNGRKPVLVKLHRNINKSLEQLSPFIFNEWKFDNTNSIKLHKSLTEKDQVVFGMDVKDLIWKSYFNDLVLGVRTFLNKENLNTIPLAKKKHKYLWLLNICVQIFVIHALCFLVCTCTGMSLLTGIWTVPIIVFFFNFF